MRSSTWLSEPDAQAGHSAWSLRFALRLAHITGQRPADVLGMSKDHIRGEYPRVRQGKTETKLRIVVENALEELLEEIRVFEAARPKQSAPLVVNERGDRHHHVPVSRPARESGNGHRRVSRRVFEPLRAHHQHQK